eukprot:5908615-Amphidinium_carterae.1
MKQAVHSHSHKTRDIPLSPHFSCCPIDVSITLPLDQVELPYPSMLSPLGNLHKPKHDRVKHRLITDLRMPNLLLERVERIIMPLSP